MTEHENKMILIRKGTHSVSHQQSHKSTSPLCSTLLSHNDFHWIKHASPTLNAEWKIMPSIMEWLVPLHSCWSRDWFLFFFIMDFHIMHFSLFCIICLFNSDQIICIFHLTKTWKFCTQASRPSSGVSSTLSLLLWVALTCQFIFWSLTHKQVIKVNDSPKVFNVL